MKIEIPEWLSSNQETIKERIKSSFYSHLLVGGTCILKLDAVPEVKSKCLVFTV